jgi:hypothetical protein
MKRKLNLSCIGKINAKTNIDEDDKDGQGMKLESGIDFTS